MSDQIRDADPCCELCGEPMPPGEEMFKYHGYSGPCPKPPKQVTRPKSSWELRCEQAERDRDAEAENARLAQDRVQRLTEGNLRLVGLLDECRSILMDVMKVEGISGTMNWDALADFVARLDAALGGRDE